MDRGRVRMWIHLLIIFLTLWFCLKMQYRTHRVHKSILHTHTPIMLTPDPRSSQISSAVLVYKATYFYQNIVLHYPRKINAISHLQSSVGYWYLEKQSLLVPQNCAAVHTAARIQLKDSFIFFFRNFPYQMNSRRHTAKQNGRHISSWTISAWTEFLWHTALSYIVQYLILITYYTVLYFCIYNFSYFLLSFIFYKHYSPNCTWF